jgi:hypothetical protein
MQRRRIYVVLFTAFVAATIGLASGRGGIRIASVQSKPPPGLTVYGQTLWNLDALLHDTFGSKTTCIRWRDYAFVSRTCGDLARYGYWNSAFTQARGSRFKLVRLAHPPALGNVIVVTVNGRYVSCGRFPGWGALAHFGSRTRRWLVAVHGWALTPFMCLGQ